MCRMVLEWREREHGDVEEDVQGDLTADPVDYSSERYNMVHGS